MSMNNCWGCGEEVMAKRWELGHRLCLKCGEAEAIRQRQSWCVVQEYGKGGYQYVTQEKAEQTLKQTNQKRIRE